MWPHQPVGRHGAGGTVYPVVRRARTEMLVRQQELLRGIILVPDVERHGLARPRAILQDRIDSGSGHRSGSLVSCTHRQHQVPSNR